MWLADTGSLGPTPGAELKRLYQDAAHQLYRSTLEFDSVVTQLGLLADFLRCRDAGDPRCAVLDALAVEADRKGLELIGCVDERLPATLVGDPGRLRLQRCPDRALPGAAAPAGRGWSRPAAAVGCESRVCAVRRNG